MSKIVQKPRFSARRRRADAGGFRLHPALKAKLVEIWSSRNDPKMSAVICEISEFCRKAQIRPPSRAALYRWRKLLPLAPYRRGDLPEAVRESLYNLDDDARLPGEQLVFHAFNYGSTAAMSFAAGLPITCLERAERLGGWRPKSLSLLRSVLLCRRA